MAKPVHLTDQSADKLRQLISGKPGNHPPSVEHGQSTKQICYVEITGPADGDWYPCAAYAMKVDGSELEHTAEAQAKPTNPDFAVEEGKRYFAIRIGTHTEEEEAPKARYSIDAERVYEFDAITHVEWDGCDLVFTLTHYVFTPHLDPDPPDTEELRLTLPTQCVEVVTGVTCLEGGGIQTTTTFVRTLVCDLCQGNFGGGLFPVRGFSGVGGVMASYSPEVGGLPTRTVQGAGLVQAGYQFVASGRMGTVEGIAPASPSSGED